MANHGYPCPSTKVAGMDESANGCAGVTGCSYRLHVTHHHEDAASQQACCQAQPHQMELLLQVPANTKTGYGERMRGKKRGEIKVTEVEEGIDRNDTEAD